MIWAAQKGLPKFSFLRNRNKQLMSDGNFNRNLLPYHNYQSGVRAGRAQMKAMALQTVQDVLHDNLPDLPATLEEKILCQIHDKLS